MNKNGPDGRPETSVSQVNSGALGGDAVGLAAGTCVAGSVGWLQADRLVPGNSVLTFDNGLQPIKSVETGCLWTGPLPVPEPLQPLAVPHGTLGNAAELLLLPEQPVLIESDIAEAMFGDPFALVVAEHLNGFRGIRRVSPEDQVTSVRLTFEEDQLIFAGLGALFFCPAVPVTGKLSSEAPASRYHGLRRDQTLALIARMAREPGFGNDPFDPPHNAQSRMRIISA